MQAVCHASPPSVHPGNIKRKVVDLPHAYRLLNHGPVTLVSSAHGGAQNVMAAAWAMPLDFTPPKVAVVIEHPQACRNPRVVCPQHSLSRHRRQRPQGRFRIGMRS